MRNLTSYYEDAVPPPRTIAALLALTDHCFVETAYREILGREGDLQGVVSYLDALRRGEPKIQILKSLRQSEEGRRFVPAIAGLDKAIRRYSIGRLPLVGWVFRNVWKTDGDSAAERRMRQLQHDVDRLNGQFMTLNHSLANGDKATQPSRASALRSRPSIFAANGMHAANNRGPLENFYEKTVLPRP